VGLQPCASKFFIFAGFMVLCNLAGETDATACPYPHRPPAPTLVFHLRQHIVGHLRQHIVGPHASSSAQSEAPTIHTC
jgi:hypothetical protein